ncbi:hypothetical protein EsH8_I_001529 [Colletotrichum jinshuiense]
MDAAMLTFLGAPDFPAVKSSVSRLLSDMGGASSRPPPPPRVAKTLPSTTVWVQHLPPIISEATRQAILATTLLRNRYLAGDETGSGPQEVASLVNRLDALIEEAQEAANIRDFTVLVVEKTILCLVTDYSSPSKQLLELARAVNPFLNRQTADDDEPGPSSVSAAEGNVPAPFRQSDLSFIDDPEKDLLVLLYYCGMVNLKGAPDEAVAQLSKMAEKHGNIKDLDLRKESLSETEVDFT